LKYILQEQGHLIDLLNPGLRLRKYKSKIFQGKIMLEEWQILINTSSIVVRLKGHPLAESETIEHKLF
jgi:hypothetical protein